MGFEAFLGNDRVKGTLSASIQRGHISHFYLISGPKGSGKHTLAKLLAAAILCRREEKPCLSCLPCRKVMEGNHPDFITVADPDHKTVPVRMVREYREDVFIRPNESDHKIYLFPQELGVEGQNALLKILEEPPAYGVFILLADNPEKLLPTVRSRCTELKLLPLPEKLLHRQLRQDFPKADEADITAAMGRSGGFLGQARDILNSDEEFPSQTRIFAAAYAGRSGLVLAQTLIPLGKWKRDDLIDLLQSWLELMEQALACRTGGLRVGTLARDMARSRSSEDLLAAAKGLQKALDYARSNVSPAAICEYLQWVLR